MDMFFLVILYLIIAIALIVVWYLVAQEFYVIAQEKGYDNKKYLWLPFIFGAVGCLLVVALPDRKSTSVISGNNPPNSDNQNINGSLQGNAESAKVINGKWVCKKCGTSNLYNARMCKGCGAFR